MFFYWLYIWKITTTKFGCSRCFSEQKIALKLVIFWQCPDLVGYISSESLTIPNLKCQNVKRVEWAPKASDWRVLGLATMPTPEAIKQLIPFSEKIWKMPNHKRDMGKNMMCPQLFICNMPSGHERVWAYQEQKQFWLVQLIAFCNTVCFSACLDNKNCYRNIPRLLQINKQLSCVLKISTKLNQKYWGEAGNCSHCVIPAALAALSAM